MARAGEKAMARGDFKERYIDALEDRGIFLKDYTRIEELADAVDSWVLHPPSLISFDLKSTLLNVLIRMPQEVADYLVNGRILAFVIPYHGILCMRTFSNGHSLCVDPYWFAHATYREAVYAFAHELAHVFLDYPRSFSEEAMELEADRLVVKWGFEEELRACPYNYLYGVGLDRLRFNSRR
jgi:hypothetical protein